MASRQEQRTNRASPAMTRRQTTTTAQAEFVARLIAETPRAVGAELAREAMALTDALACGYRLANPGGSWCQRLRGPGPLCISAKPENGCSFSPVLHTHHARMLAQGIAGAVLREIPPTRHTRI